MVSTLSCLSTDNRGKTAVPRHAATQDTPSMLCCASMDRGQYSKGHTTPMMKKPALQIERCVYASCDRDQSLNGISELGQTYHHALQSGDNDRAPEQCSEY